MYSFEIIPDTACDLTADLRERFGINDYLKGIIYDPEGNESILSLDWEEKTSKEYYNSMKGHKALYTTATPPLGSIYETFEKHLKEGRDILSISLSGGLSSSYATCVKVAEDLKTKYPDRKIICVDSMRYSTALALLVIEACLKRQEGKSIEEVAEYILATRHTVHQIGMMDDLFFLVKTGRVTNFKAFFGQMIGLNIMADFNHKGMAEVVGKCKGQRDAIEATVRYMEQTIENPRDQIVFVAYTNRDVAANLLAEKIRERIQPKELIMNVVGMACGATIGPGMCAAFYKGKPITEDLAEEKALMIDVLASVQKK